MDDTDRSGGFAAWARSTAFEASEAPYLVLDRSLHIRAVNAAYEKATLQPREQLLGRFMFDAFPDNPATPDACSVTNLARSIELVFRRKRADRMALQRYDVPAPAGDGSFVPKVWRPRNSPLRDGRGTVTGVLHHVEDVTDAVVSRRPFTLATPPVSETQEQLLAAIGDLQSVNDRLNAENEHLRTALATNRTVATAIGIIMFSHKVTAEVAFDLLRERSHATHRKLRELAEDVMAQGCLEV